MRINVVNKHDALHFKVEIKIKWAAKHVAGFSVLVDCNVWYDKGG